MSIMRRPIVMAACLSFLACPALAEGVIARYSVEAAGIPVMQFEAQFRLSADGYSAIARAATTGVARLVFRGDQEVVVQGRWRGQMARPMRYTSEGAWRGNQRQVQMDYPGGQPRIGVLQPPASDEAQAVPEAMQRDTTDGLSAIAQLIRVVTQTGRCDARAQVFDGRYRTDYTVTTVGIDRAAPGAAAFGPEALRCNLVSQRLAGLGKDEDADRVFRARESALWMLPARPDRPPVPLRVEIPNRWFGTISAVLESVEPLADEVAENRR